MTQRKNTPRTTRQNTRILILALATSAIALGGCSKSDDAKKAVNDAGLEFSKISVGDTTLSASVAAKSYQSAADSTSEHAGNDKPYGEAAAVTLSLSKLGMATLAGGEVSKIETAAMHQSRIIRGHLSEWIAMNAVARASMNFDPTEDKNALKNLIELRKSDVVQYTDLHTSLQNEIHELQAQIGGLDSKSTTERNESARFELQMTSVSATQAAQLAERVREHSLRADDYELESLRLQGHLGQLLPGAHEIELQVKKATDQIALLNLSIDELDQRVRDSEQDSAQARANAQAARSKLVELVNELEDYRQNTVAPASEKVISLIRQSLTAARGASKTAKSSGAIAKASAQEQLGRSLSRQARGEAEMVSLYRSILSAGVDGNWQSNIDSHSSKFDELTVDTQQAFQDAASALRSARIRGAEGESLEAAAVRLDKLGGVEPEPEYTEEYETEDSEFEESELDAESMDEVPESDAIDEDD
jgi:FtsZ-binding cell division protein ZapB